MGVVELKDKSTVENQFNEEITWIMLTQGYEKIDFNKLKEVLGQADDCSTMNAFLDLSERERYKVIESCWIAKRVCKPKAVINSGVVTSAIRDAISKKRMRSYFKVFR